MLLVVDHWIYETVAHPSLTLSTVCHCIWDSLLPLKRNIFVTTFQMQIKHETVTSQIFLFLVNNLAFLKLTGKDNKMSNHSLYQLTSVQVTKVWHCVRMQKTLKCIITCYDGHLRAILKDFLGPLIFHGEINEAGRCRWPLTQASGCFKADLLFSVYQ